MTPAQILEMTAVRLHLDGWTQGGCTLDDSAACVGNMIAFVCASKGLEIHAARNIQRIFARALPLVKSGWRFCHIEYEGARDLARIYDWNDDPARTKEEVIAMLRAVAATLRAADNEGTRQQQPVAEEVI